MKGAKVVATDVNDALLRRRSQRSMKRFGDEAVIGLKHNFATESDWVDVVSKAVEAFGKVDTLINTGQTQDVWDIDADETIRILNVNILGTLLGGCDAEMKKNGTGSIVNIWSAPGLVGGVSGGPAAYSSIKDALRAITKEIALDVAKADVRREYGLIGPHPHPHYRSLVEGNRRRGPIEEPDGLRRPSDRHRLRRALPRRAAVRDQHRHRHHHRRRLRRPVKETS